MQDMPLVLLTVTGMRVPDDAPGHMKMFLIPSIKSNCAGCSVPLLFASNVV